MGNEVRDHSMKHFGILQPIQHNFTHNGSQDKVSEEHFSSLLLNMLVKVCPENLMSYRKEHTSRFHSSIWLLQTHHVVIHVCHWSSFYH